MPFSNVLLLEILPKELVAGQYCKYSRTNVLTTKPLKGRI